MCGRYLIEEEAYSDILEILYRSGTISLVSHNVTNQIPMAVKDSIIASMPHGVSEIVPDTIRDLFPDSSSQAVTNGEVFPTNIAPVLTRDGVALIKWGFPHWKGGNVIINARSETALDKPMFRKSLLEQRCVIPSNGFYEWGYSGDYDNLQIGMFGSGQSSFGDNRSRRGKKVKYLLRRPNEHKLYMAGFWSTFDDCRTFVILTTAANESVAPIHNRMPVILSADERDDWLSDMSFAEHVLHRTGSELCAAKAG